MWNDMPIPKVVKIYLGIDEKIKLLYKSKEL